MLSLTKPVAAMGLIAAAMMSMPTEAPARTEDIVKYGAITLGAAAIYNAGQRSVYRPYYPAYGYYPPHYAAPVYPAYPVYPVVPVYGGCHWHH